MTIEPLSTVHCLSKSLPLNISGVIFREYLGKNLVTLRMEPVPAGRDGQMQPGCYAGLFMNNICYIDFLITRLRRGSHPPVHYRTWDVLVPEEKEQLRR